MPPVAPESSEGWQHREQVELNHQVQAHIETIQALEAEKTELQTVLYQSQQAAMQTAIGAEKLQGRL